MTPTRQGSFHLFRFAGIDLYLHWSWFVIAIIEVNSRRGLYTSSAWNVLEYLGLFAIVLLHEFGHALACRQVGGQANQIVLWPLGGVAYVAPPPRPGAMLWSIAAGPLVNVALLPILFGLYMLGQHLGWKETMPDFQKFLWAIASVNAVLLIFNLLPIYPLDGGQILRSLLWFVLGRARSLMISAYIGFVGVAALIGIALLTKQIMLGAVAVFILLNCWNGLLQARLLARIAAAPRRPGLACPACGLAPPAGAFWGCHRCRARFDIFEVAAVCPGCQTQFPAVVCPECGAGRPIQDWFRGPPPL